MRVVNISDPENPEEAGYVDPGFVLAVTVSGDYAYLAAGSGGLHVINISDPENLEGTGYYDTPGNAYGVTVSGDYAYVADLNHGLRVVNISDPENPVEVGYYDTPGMASGVALSDYGLIYVADRTNMGIYRFTDPADVDDPTISTPKEFRLFTAYPNPFNSTTTIRYGLPSPDIVSLQLYNLSGQRITTLYEGHQQAGFHSETMSASDLSSGLYIVKLEASENIFAKKVMLIK